MGHNRRKCITDFRIHLDSAQSVKLLFLGEKKRAHGKGPNSSEPPKPCMSIGTLKWAKTQNLLVERHQIIWKFVKLTSKKIFLKFSYKFPVLQKSEIVSSEHGRLQGEASSM